MDSHSVRRVNEQTWHPSTDYAFPLLLNFAKLARMNTNVMLTRSMIPYFYDALWIESGEDVCETILSFFRRRQCIPADLKDKTFIGMILSSLGCVSCPELKSPDSSVSRKYQGAHDILSLDGSYCIPEDGDVQLVSGLQASLGGPQGVVGGHVVGSLIAESRLQMILAYYTQPAPTQPVRRSRRLLSRQS